MSGILGMNVPFFLLVVFSFSYCLWAKYLNYGSLKFELSSTKSTDKLSEVLTIFTILLATFLIIPLSAYLIKIIIDLELTSSRMLNIWNITTYFTTIFGLILFLFFISTTRGKKVKKKELFKAFYWILFYFLLFIAFFLGLSISTFLFDLKLFTFLFVAIFTIQSAILFVLTYLLENLIGSPLSLSKNAIIFFTIFFFSIIFLTVFFCNLNITQISDSTNNKESYIITTPTNQYTDGGNNYIYTTKTLQFRNNTKYNLFNFILIDYTDLNLDLSTINSREKFEIAINYINSTSFVIINGINSIPEFNKRINKNGFSKIQPINNQDIILLRYNSADILKDIQNITVKGYSKIKINRSNFLFDIDKDGNVSNFNILINMFNNLDLPITLPRETLFDFDILNVNYSSCNITHFDFLISDVDSISYTKRLNIEDKKLNFQIIDISKNRKQNIIDFKIAFDDSELIFIPYEIRNKINITFYLNTSCTPLINS
jgi:hypothetical protein